MVTTWFKLFKVYDQIFSDWELLIIDDGSTDDSREKIESATVEKHDENQVIFNDRPRLPFVLILPLVRRTVST